MSSTDPPVGMQPLHVEAPSLSSFDEVRPRDIRRSFPAQQGTAGLETQLRAFRPIVLTAGACIFLQTVLQLVLVFRPSARQTSSRKWHANITAEPFPLRRRPVPPHSPVSPLKPVQPHQSPLSPFENHAKHEGNKTCKGREYIFPHFGLGSPQYEQKFTAHRSDFMTLWTRKNNTQLMILEFAIDRISRGKALHVGVGAIYMKGEFAHMDATDTSGTALDVRLALDEKYVEIFQPKLWLLTGDSGPSGFKSKVNEHLLNEARGPELVTRLPVVGFRRDKDCHPTHVLVVASSIMTSGAFVVNTYYLAGQMPHLEPSTIRSFPYNIDFTVLYSKEILHSLSPMMQWQYYKMNMEEQVIRYCIYELPKTPLPKRMADKRVGFFHQEFKLLGDYRGEKGWDGYRNEELIDPIVRVIQRQRLDAEKQTIFYYVDHTVPEEYREATRRGIEIWQGAFGDLQSGADFKPQIRALVPGDDKFPKDYDPADIRFNSISWCTGTGGSAFAIGQSVTDPRSGEVLKANIVFTLGWLRGWLGNQVLFHGGVPKATLVGEEYAEADTTLDTDASESIARTLQDIKRYHESGESAPEGLDSPPIYGSNESGSHPRWLPRDRKYWPCQHHGISLKHRHPYESLMCHALHDHSSHVWLLAVSQDDASVKKYLQDGIASITSHEVGHTLGLRHNFHGSAAYKLEDLQDPAFVQKHGVTASVMDYMPANTISKKKRREIIQSKFSGKDPGPVPPFSPVVGAYDKWVIKYGYMKIDSSDAAAHGCCGNHAALRTLASKIGGSIKQSYSFATDEDLWIAPGVDPYTNVFDMGSEPFDYHEDRMWLVQEAHEKLFERAVRMGEAFTRIFSAQFRLLLMVYQSAAYLAQYIGGVRLSKTHAAKDCTDVSEGNNCLPVDARHPFEPVSPELQEKAANRLIELVIMAAVGSGDVSVFGKKDLKRWSVGTGATFYGVKPSDYGTWVKVVKSLMVKIALDATRLRRAWGGAETWSDGATSFATDKLIRLFSDKVLLVKNDITGNWNAQMTYLDHLVDLSKCSSCNLVGEEVASLATAEVFRVKKRMQTMLSSLPEAEGPDKNSRVFGFLNRAIAKLESALAQPINIRF